MNKWVDFYDVCAGWASDWIDTQYLDQIAAYVPPNQISVYIQYGELFANPNFEFFGMRKI
jgi:hypothetical protein